MADDQNTDVKPNEQSPDATAPTIPDDIKQTLQRYETEINKLKTENADRRITHKQLLDSIAKAIGIEDMKTKDGEALVNELKSIRDELQKEKLTNRFNAVAKRLDADKKANLIYAVIKDQGQLSELTDEATIEESIKQIIKDYPELKNPITQKVGDDTTSTNESNTGKSVNQLIRQAAGHSV
jgi:hypothetical protein